MRVHLSLVIDSVGAAAAVAAAATCAVHLPSIRYGLDLGDEGYLWHGTLQVLEGKIPIRDFRAYDPARYYWCALWCLVFGRRNLSIRAAMMAVQIGGLWLGLILVHDATRSWPATALWALPMAACMRPWYRQIESISPIVTVFAGVALLAHPTPALYFAAGMSAGLAVLVGLNLAIYSGSALFMSGSALFMLMLVTRGPARQPGLSVSLGWYLLGAAAGSILLLLLFAAIPRFFSTYRRMKIERVIERRSTNLPLPVPWLWRLTPGAWTVCELAVRTSFTFLPLFYLASVGWLLLGSHEPSLRFVVFAVSVCVGIAYAHQAFSRADAIHLPGAIQPVLLALSVLLFSSTTGWFAAGVIVVATAWAVASGNGHLIARMRNPNGFCRFATDHDVFWLRSSTAAQLEAMRAAVDAHSDRAEQVLFVPNVVTLYPLLGRTPAVYDVYCVYPATELSQREMIASIVAARVRLALVWNLNFDGREDLRFGNTHPLVWRHLEDNFESLAASGLPVDFRCFAR